MGQLEDLKAELEAGHPDTGAYDPDDATAADQLNAINRVVKYDLVETGDIRASITFDAFDGLVTSEQAWFEWLTQNGVIPVNDHLLQKLAGIPTASESIWAAADRVEANAVMEALMQRTVSRANELGLGLIRPANVTEARAF